MRESDPEKRARARVHATLIGSWRVDRFVSFDKAVAAYEVTHADGRRGLARVLLPEPSRDRDAAGRFFRGSRVAALVRHPQVIEIFEEGETDDGCACAIERLLPGATCRDVAEGRTEKRLEVEEVLHVAERALEGLAAAHEKGVLHANLKPDKLFWTEDGDVVIVGWDSARFFGPSAPELGLPDPRGEGTPAFIPPEQALGEWERLDARSDVWALGATMFALFTGGPVRRERNRAQQLLAAMTKPAPALASVAPHLPEDLCALVDGALAFDPQDRWPHATAMLQALRLLRAPAIGTVVLPDEPPAGAALPFQAAGAAARPEAHAGASDPKQAVYTGTLYGGRAAGRKIVPFHAGAQALAGGAPATDAAGAERGEDAPVTDAAGLALLPGGAAFVDTYAALKVAQLSEPAAFRDRLQGRGLDEIVWRIGEARLCSVLDQEARRGRSATAHQLAQAMDRALRGAQG